MNKNQPVKILVILRLPTDYLHKIKQYFEGSGFSADVYKPEVCTELIFNCIELYDAVIIDEAYPFDEEILSQAKNLKAIGVLGKAYSVDIDAATSNNIIVEECTTNVVDAKSAEAMACHFAWLYSTHRTTMKYIPQVKRVEYVKEQNARSRIAIAVTEDGKEEHFVTDPRKSRKKVQEESKKLLTSPKNWSTKKKVAVGTGAAVAGVAGIAAIPFAMGFTAGGVLAGSIAAGIQASIGSVAAGSLFAAAQSLAATTIIGTAAPAAAAAAGAATAGGAALLMDDKKKKGDDN